MIKQKLISTEYPNEIHFYGIKEGNCSKDIGSFNYGLLFP
jgi:hypothetical protein